MPESPLFFLAKLKSYLSPNLASRGSSDTQAQCSLNCVEDVGHNTARCLRI